MYRTGPTTGRVQTRWEVVVEWWNWHVWLCEEAPGPLVLLPILPVALLLGGLLLNGCTATGQAVQRTIADSTALAANTALPILVQKYREEGNAVIEHAKTREEAETGIAAVKERWKPVWTAWEGLRAAQDAWATALESGGDATAALSGLRAAYCDLQAVWPEDIPAIPLSMVTCGGGP